jgi:hypothetical protein
MNPENDEPTYACNHIESCDLRTECKRARPHHKNQFCEIETSCPVASSPYICMCKLTPTGKPEEGLGLVLI